MRMKQDTYTAAQRIELLQEAQSGIYDVVGLLQEALRGTRKESAAEAYIVGHLLNWAEGRESTSINNLIEYFETPDSEEE